MCPALTDGNENYAQLLKDKRALHINTYSNSLNKRFIFSYFHFAMINVYQFLQLGQVVLHILLAFLFLLQQVKKIPSKQKPAEKLEWLYLLVFKQSRASFLLEEIILGAVPDSLRAAFPVAGSSSRSLLPHLHPTCARSLKRVTRTGAKQQPEEEMLGNAPSIGEGVGKQESQEAAAISKMAK